MKLRSMEEKISYRLFLMGFLGLLFTAALCIFVFHKAFTAQAWTSLEREADLVSAGYDLVQDPQQLSSFVTNDPRITLISQDAACCLNLLPISPWRTISPARRSVRP